MTSPTKPHNPVVRSWVLTAAPGWMVRQYANGIHDAAQIDGPGLSPGFTNYLELREWLGAVPEVEVNPRDPRGIGPHRHSWERDPATYTTHRTCQLCGCRQVKASGRWKVLMGGSWGGRS